MKYMDYKKTFSYNSLAMNGLVFNFKTKSSIPYNNLKYSFYDRSNKYNRRNNFKRLGYRNTNFGTRLNFIFHRNFLNFSSHICDFKHYSGDDIDNYDYEENYEKSRELFKRMQMFTFNKLFRRNNNDEI